MQSMYYVGLDVHKKTIRYCVKDVSRNIQGEGSLHPTRSDLERFSLAPSGAGSRGAGARPPSCQAGLACVFPTPLHPGEKTGLVKDVPMAGPQLP